MLKQSVAELLEKRSKCYEALHVETKAFNEIQKSETDKNGLTCMFVMIYHKFIKQTGAKELK